MYTYESFLIDYIAPGCLVQCIGPYSVLTELVLPLIGFCSSRFTRGDVFNADVRLDFPFSLTLHCSAVKLCPSVTAAVYCDAQTMSTISR